MPQGSNSLGHRQSQGWHPPCLRPTNCAINSISDIITLVLSNNPFFNEHAADQEVINSLWRSIKKLEKELENDMSQIILIKNEDGSVKRATDFENVDRDYIVTKIQKHQALAAKWESALSIYDSLTGEGEQPATEEPAPVEAPA